MRKFLALALGFTIILTGAFSSASSKVVLRDPGDPFPWGFEIPFPWSRIEGTWLTKINGEYNFVSFKVVKNADGVRKLKVFQYDSGTCEIVAQGAGFEELDHTVKALMVSDAGPFRLKVHVFRQSDLKTQKGQSYVPFRDDQTVTVMSIGPLSDDSPKGDRKRVFQLQWLDPDPFGICPILYPK